MIAGVTYLRHELVQVVRLLADPLKARLLVGLQVTLTRMRVR